VFLFRIAITLAPDSFRLVLLFIVVVNENKLEAKIFKKTASNANKRTIHSLGWRADHVVVEPRLS
jgi:hypothetical protein